MLKLHHYLKEINYAFGFNEPAPFFNEYGEFVNHYKITNLIYKDNITVIYNDVGNFTSWAPEDQQFQINTEAITWKLGSEVGCIWLMMSPLSLPLSLYN